MYIWNKPFKWFNYGFDKDGIQVYTEPFANALKEFYSGVSGCIYTGEGNFDSGAQTGINIAIVSWDEVSIKEKDYVSDIYKLLLGYERQ